MGNFNKCNVSFVVLTMVVLVMSEGSRAVSLCNINDDGVNACRPAVSSQSPSVDPSADCCKALKGADLTCLCSYKNSPMLPMLGIEPNLAMALPKKCGITTATPC